MRKQDERVRERNRERQRQRQGVRDSGNDEGQGESKNIKMNLIWEILSMVVLMPQSVSAVLTSWWANLAVMSVLPVFKNNDYTPWPLNQVTH